MRIKIIGFKVGVSRPTCNKTLDMGELTTYDLQNYPRDKLGEEVFKALWKSDFLSIRRVD